MNFYCTTEHCSCMGIKQFSAGKTVRCTDIVNIGLHFFLKNVRPYAVACIEA